MRVVFAGGDGCDGGARSNGDSCGGKEKSCGGRENGGDCHPEICTLTFSIIF